MSLKSLFESDSMDDTKVSGLEQEKTTLDLVPPSIIEEDPNSINSVAASPHQALELIENPNTVMVETNQSIRTPFTNLSQVDADLALARTLQEQERAYVMLRMNSGEGSDYGSWETGSYEHEDDFGDTNSVNEDDQDEYDDNDAGNEDAFDAHAEEDSNPSFEFNSSNYSSDAAYARALQDAEDQEMAARLFALAGLSEREVEDIEDEGGNPQDMWDEVDPDELSYEELIALGEVVGIESRGLSADRIASLPSIKYSMLSIQDGSNDSCVICRLDYEDDDTLTLLRCKHTYHVECVNNWLQINKVCPVCNTEVSTSENL